ncbi:MAG: YihY/virulence factor BrkB family protein [Alphaproteobacteria bacterium]|nr:MAG: YihY/virulence factor BrkB family protein [Alphaproteobacteria bacterium]
MFFSRLHEQLREKIWEGELRHPARRWSMALLRLTVAVLRDMTEGRFNERAASLSYTTLLSFAPLLAVTFSVLKGFGVRGALEPVLRSFLGPLGKNSEDITQKLIEFAEKIQINVLGVVGVTLLLWGVVILMWKIERAVNDIWRVTETRSLVQRVRDYLSVLLIGPVLLFLSMGMTAALRHAGFVAAWLHIDLSSAGFEMMFATVPYILFMIAFTALFMFMPNTRVKPGPALAAGLFTGIVWKVLGKLFAIFVSSTGNVALVYSAFATMVLFMIWVYVGWMTVLAGAAVSYYLQNPSNQSMSRRIRNLSLRVKEKLALQICVEIGDALYKGAKPLTLQNLAARLKIPALAVDDVTEDLVVSGVLTQSAEQGRPFMPARPFDTTSVEEMLKCLRAADETGVLQVNKIHGSPAVDKVLKATERAMHKELGKITLKQLALGSTEE